MLELMCWRNERTFYNAKCASCGANMISVFSPNSPLKLGARFSENLPGTFGKGTITANAVPDNIKLTSPEILNEIFECEICKRNYKIINQEFTFYKKIGVPLPRKCPQCRYRARMASRTPRALQKRKCMNSECQNEFLTAYPPDRSEKIYCESCYQKL